MKKIISLLSVGLSCVAFSTIAQSNTVSHTVTIQIQKSTSLRLKPNTILQENFVAHTASDMQYGMENELAGTYQVRSNEQWIVQVSTPQATWHYQGNSDNPQMPSSLLHVKASSDNSYLPLSQQGNTLAQGKAGDFGGQNEFEVDYKLQTGLEFPAGTYQTDVSFTVSNP